MFYIFEEHIKIKTFENKLATVEMSQSERIYLKSVARSIASHKLMDFVISQLPEKQKKDLAKKLKAKTPSLEVHKYLHQSIPDYRTKLNGVVVEIEKELIELIPGI